MKKKKILYSKKSILKVEIFAKYTSLQNGQYGFCSQFNVIHNQYFLFES